MKYIIGHLKPDLDSAVAAQALEYLYEKVPCFSEDKCMAVCAGEPNFETKTIFKKFKAKIPPILDKTNADDTFVLVDHNEEDQRHKAIANEKITDIVDHHKIALRVPFPIFMTVKPWGSSNTVVYWMMEINKINPDKTLATLMLSAIISDTLNFKMSTTTEKDKEVFEKLKKISGIDTQDLIQEILNAKTSLDGLSLRQIVTKDYKEYKFNGKKILINQVETANQEKILKDSGKMISELNNLKKDMGLDWTITVVTDIFKVNSKVLITKDDEFFLTKAFPKAKKVKSGVYDIGPLMSRKKEIVPPIEKVF